MIFYPAIDLKDGRCVRLVRGEMESATVFNERPGEQAVLFAAAGCTWVHVVDLDGAFAGRPVNTAAVEAILRCRNIKVQLGGGIRNMDTVRQWLDRGVHRVILGTAAVYDPAFAMAACQIYPGRVAIGIDARDGLVAVEGWSDTTRIPVLQVAERFQPAEPAAIIYTDIARDGAMEGPNIEATLALARAVTTPVIASGGVASMADLRALRQAGEGVLDGVICGRAVYEGHVDPAAAVALLASVTAS
ncbi:MAG: 1-(5-phosphoribosyl)-5-[(5-phosphoribosylamino)methylideneamino]imidazole-4-carboxamide isomerase [Rhodospirillales bacterium]|nr:MAG: 1-(5-phosphoribosyl)-5-[(5-phosphoribosylamino)methylideneamino]imidazole-4-carboxamide isomerase [Rhodospirillales bacterium]